MGNGSDGLPAPLVGVDLGGTHLRVGLVEGDAVAWEHREKADLARHCRADRAAESLAYVLDTLAAAIGIALERRPDVAAIGLAFPGFFSSLTGLLTLSPNLPGLVDVDVATPLAELFSRPVIAENDALAAAFGEYRLHPDRPASLLYVGLGTGVGGGMVLEGQPYRGVTGCAMEVGHVIVEPGGRRCGCGNRGCLEQYASATGVAESYRRATGEERAAVAIADRARDGDAAARAAFERAGEALGTVIAHLMKTIEVPDLVVGGGLSAAWDLIGPSFDRRLEQDLLPLLRGRARVRLSTAGDQAGMLGAAWLGRAGGRGPDDGEQREGEQR